MVKGKDIVLKRMLLCVAFVVATFLFGMYFTAIRTNALGSDSFEAAHTQEYNISILEELG